MGLKAHAPSARTSRNKGESRFIEQMAELLDMFALPHWRGLAVIAALFL
jgi:hypothetical protein